MLSFLSLQLLLTLGNLSILSVEEEVKEAPARDTV